jgi:hypothetical protein
MNANSAGIIRDEGCKKQKIFSIFNIRPLKEKNGDIQIGSTWNSAACVIKIIFSYIICLF